MDGVKLAALYTLQDRLARDAEQMRGFEHGHVTIWGVLHELRTQVIGEPDSPRRAGRHLLSGDKAIIEPTMQGRRCHAERVRGAIDGHAVSVWRVLCGFEARDLPVSAQAADAIGRERQARRGGSSL